MKIAWISSWPPRPCGIATYSLELVEAIRKKGNDVHIICHPDGGSPGEKNVYPIMNTKEIGWDEEVYSTVKKINPDIVHIQHEYGLYQTNKDMATGLFRPLFRWKMEANFPLVVTYHSVYSTLDKMRACYMDLMQKLVDAGVVHQIYQWVNLPVNVGYVMDNIYVIPHGAKEEIKINREDAKKSLNLEGKRIVGMLGWFTPTKGFHRVIKMWDTISQELGPQTYLLLAGDARLSDPDQEEYKNKLLSLIEQCKFKNRIKVILGSFSPEEYEKILGSFDVMVMPYTFASQSGNLAHSFALGVPVVASGIEGLKAEIEASGAGIAVPPENEEELRRAILTIMKESTLREKYSQRARFYVKEKIGWSIIAEKHMRLYKKLLQQRGLRKKDIKSEVTLES